MGLKGGHRSRFRWYGAKATMNDDTERSANNSFSVNIPKILMERVEAYCQSSGITPIEFIIDAISEKLASIYKEKRRKPRL